MSELFEAGLAVRREVLGADYVDQSILQVDPFMAEFQTFVTEHCWGSIWTREGLPRKTRSMLNLAMLTALNRPNEIKLHVRAALTNGVTPDEIKEIFLQCAVYAGVPAAFDSFLIARDVLSESAPAEAA